MLERMKYKRLDIFQWWDLDWIMKISSSDFRIEIDKQFFEELNFQSNKLSTIFSNH
jgi:hypothetical protein